MDTTTATTFSVVSIIYDCYCCCSSIIFFRKCGGTYRPLTGGPVEDDTGVVFVAVFVFVTAATIGGVETTLVDCCNVACVDDD